jgi:MinD-like ATPase involved in chromosome partitioning or flagellar assembly
VSERYVILGLAHPRSPWFGEVTRWATAGAAPIDFVKCVSAEEVHARLAAGRVVSALLADADRIANDRDLVDRATRGGCAVVVVDDGRLPRDWRALGVTTTLLTGFTRDELLGTLAAHAKPVGRVDHGIAMTAAGSSRATAAPGSSIWRGKLVAVTGAGGTGASTVAMALAQGAAADAQNRGMVMLADLSLDADLAMLHDARDVVPGLQELVDACRGGTPGDDLGRLVHHVTDRGYDLVLGLRRHRDWTAIRPRAFDTALDALRRRYRLVVADVDRDVEGEEETGSLDVAERNHIARRTLHTADVVVVVGNASMKGLHSLTRTLHELRAGQVDPGRLVALVNRVGRSPRTRAEISRALAGLGALDGAASATPIFVPERRHLDDGLVHAAPLPATLTTTVATAVGALLDRTAPTSTATDAPGPVAIVPGSLGDWYDEPEDAA